MTAATGVKARKSTPSTRCSESTKAVPFKGHGRGDLWLERERHATARRPWLSAVPTAVEWLDYSTITRATGKPVEFRYLAFEVAHAGVGSAQLKPSSA